MCRTGRNNHQIARMKGLGLLNGVTHRFGYVQQNFTVSGSFPIRQSDMKHARPCLQHRLHRLHRPEVPTGKLFASGRINGSQ